jgi:Na+/H+-translocating membrane pyrophosphatase
MDIPEDDPRNLAVIADNVGDNVGDVAGMGDDFLQLVVGSVIAAVALTDGDMVKVMLAFWVAGCAILCSMIGCFDIGTKEGATQKQLLVAAILCRTLIEGKTERWNIFSCIVWCPEWPSRGALYFLSLLAYQVHP